MGKGMKMNNRYGTRQQWRLGVLMVSMLLFPVTIYYFSPYLIIYGAAQGLLVGSAIVFMGMYISSIFLGRLFCGYLCPSGGVSEACMLANGQRNLGGRRKIVKYVIWVPWLGLIIMLFISNGIKNIDFFFQTDHGISVSHIYAYIIYYGVVGLIVIMAFIGGKRSFCHSVCWMAPFMQLGILTSRMVRTPRLKLEAESTACISCGKCDKACVMSLPVMEMVKVNNLDNVDCVLCGSCIDTCPKKVIRYTF